MSETENGHKASISLIWKHILGGTVLPFWGQYYSDFKTRWRYYEGKKNHRPISFMNRNIKILKKRKNTSKSKLAIYKKKESYTLAKSHPSGAKVVEYVKAN